MSEEELRVKILAFVTELRTHPSTDNLKDLLGGVECCVSKVDQFSPRLIRDAIRILTDALVASSFLEHSDDDVKVAVACCISETTRITAPTPPCDANKMREIFKLFVTSFEKLNDQSSSSYHKRVSILKNFAEFRFSFVMVKLECDGLIIDMFEYFFGAIREFHQGEVFGYMVTVMNHVLEGHAVVSLKLLPLLFASVKRDDKVMVKKLAETVLAKSAAKLGSYLKHTTSLVDDYDTVVASLLEGAVPAVDHVDDRFPEDLIIGETVNLVTCESSSKILHWALSLKICWLKIFNALKPMLRLRKEP